MKAQFPLLHKAVIACILALNAVILPVGQAQTMPGPVYAPGGIIVKLKAGQGSASALNKAQASSSVLKALAGQGNVLGMKQLFLHARHQTILARVTLPSGGSVEVPTLSNIYRVSLTGDASVPDVIARLRQDPDVEFAEPDYVAHAAGVPGDPMYAEQWALRKIRAEEAWGISTGDSTIIVGILDTGIDILHEDLAGNIWTNKNEVAGNGIDDDGNGYVDDVHGWNVVGQNNDPGDDAGHGTHVAGIVGALTDNGKGVAGVAWHVRLMPVKVLDINGQGLYSDIAEGITYAAANGAKVINMSLGGYYPSTLLETALLNAYSSCLLVAAAGNDGISDPYYPAAYPYVLAVGGTDSTDHVWSGSNYGPWVKLSAPASDIVSTLLSNSYGELSGTSMAAPMVAGAGALLLAHDPSLDARSVFNQLLVSSDRIDSMNSGYAGLIGSGRLNVLNALSNPAVPHLVLSRWVIADGAPGGNGNGILEAGESVNLTVTIRNDGRSLSGLSGQISTSDSLVTLSQSASLFGNLSARDSITNQTPFTLGVSSLTLNDHDIPLKLIISSGGSPVDTLAFSLRVKKDYSLSGLIGTNTTWTRDKQYVVTGNMLVMAGVTLTIGPGVVVKFSAGTSLRVDGTIYAVGNATDSIWFEGNSPSAGAGFWNGIDYRGGGAIVDTGWNYISGSILQYVSLRQAGIELNTTSTGSPYVSDASISDGLFGISSNAQVVVRRSAFLRCNVPILSSGNGGWIENVTIVGCDSGIVIEGQGTSIFNIRGCTISGNNRFGVIGSVVDVENSIIQNTNGDGLFLGGNSIVRRCTITGNSGVGVSGGSVAEDNLIAQNGSGGINVGGAIRRNRIMGNRGWGIVGSGIIDHNLIYGNYGGISGSGDSIVSNTIVWNGPNPGVQITGGGVVSFNNLIARKGYTASVAGSSPLLMPSNWWGTTSTGTIDSMVYDFFDDFNLGPLLYTPILTAPSSSAPAYIAGVIANPPSPVGVQPVAITLQFSRAMDTSAAPSIVLVNSAGVGFPVNINSAWIDKSHYNSTVKINDMFANGSYLIQASGGRDSLGFSAPVDTSQRLIVYTAGSASRELRATTASGEVRLSWKKSVIPNLLGYNVYRGTKSGGPYTKWNKAVIVDTTFIDTNFPATGVYYYTYTILDGNFRESPQSGEASASALAGVNIFEEIPTVFSLAQNYPNPFNPSTTIRYGIPTRSHVSLTVYNALGQQISVLQNGELDAGYHEAKFGGNGLASGVYFYRIRAGSFVQTKKLMLVH